LKDRSYAKHGFCQGITVNVPSLLAHADGEIDGQERRRRDQAGALTIRPHKFRRFAASVHV